MRRWEKRPSWTRRREKRVREGWERAGTRSEKCQALRNLRGEGGARRKCRSARRSIPSSDIYLLLLVFYFVIMI